MERRVDSMHSHESLYSVLPIDHTQYHILIVIMMHHILHLSPVLDLIGWRRITLSA